MPVLLRWERRFSPKALGLAVRFVGVMASLLPMDLAAFKVPEKWTEMDGPVGWLVECTELGKLVDVWFWGGNGVV